jgi:preprotein translocase subunit SecD
VFARAIFRLRKAGLSGLFALWTFAVAPISTVATAAPLALEVAGATASLDQRINEPIISIRLTAASGRSFGELTAANVGKAVEVRVDGKAVMKPIIREPILGGTLMISGGFTIAEARDIAGRLTAGRARIEVEVVVD